MDKGILELNCIFVKNRLIFFKAPLNAPKRLRRQNGLKEREKLANREKNGKKRNGKKSTKKKKASIRRHAQRKLFSF